MKFYSKVKTEPFANEIISLVLVVKIAANAGLSTVAQEMMEETRLHIKNSGLENCEKCQKMIRLGTVFIDSIQWLQRGSQLEKSYAGTLLKIGVF